MSNEQTAKALHIDGVQPFDCDGRKPNPVLINGERLSGMRTLSPGGHSGEERARVPCNGCGWDSRNRRESR